MTDILLALTLGVVAGAIDIIPMIKRNVPKFSIGFVFAQWVVLGLLIPFVNWKIPSWLKGLIIGELGMIPVMILTYYRNKQALPSIMIFAAVLGIGLGIAGAKFID